MLLDAMQEEPQIDIKGSETYTLVMVSKHSPLSVLSVFIPVQMPYPASRIRSGCPSRALSIHSIEQTLQSVVGRAASVRPACSCESKFLG